MIQSRFSFIEAEIGVQSPKTAQTPDHARRLIMEQLAPMPPSLKLCLLNYSQYQDNKNRPSLYIKI